MCLLIWNAKQAIDANKNGYLWYIRQRGRIRSAQQKYVYQEGTKVSQVSIKAKESNESDDNGRPLKKGIHRQAPGRCSSKQETIVQNE